MLITGTPSEIMEKLNNLIGEGSNISDELKGVVRRMGPDFLVNRPEEYHNFDKEDFERFDVEIAKWSQRASVCLKKYFTHEAICIGFQIAEGYEDDPEIIGAKKLPYYAFLQRKLFKKLKYLSDMYSELLKQYDYPIAFLADAGELIHYDTVVKFRVGSRTYKFLQALFKHTSIGEKCAAKKIYGWMHALHWKVDDFPEGWQDELRYCYREVNRRVRAEAGTKVVSSRENGNYYWLVAPASARSKY